MEEVILIDGQRLNEVILPLMNVSRRTKTGKVDENESLNKSQIYVNFFDKSLQFIVQGKSYKDYKLSYNKLTIEQKNKLASLLSN